MQLAFAPMIELDEKFDIKLLFRMLGYPVQNRDRDCAETDTTSIPNAQVKTRFRCLTLSDSVVSISSGNPLQTQIRV